LALAATTPAGVNAIVDLPQKRYTTTRKAETMNWKISNKMKALTAGATISCVLLSAGVAAASPSQGADNGGGNGGGNAVGHARFDRRADDRIGHERFDLRDPFRHERLGLRDDFRHVGLGDRRDDFRHR
jgi:hypothetical protein